MPEVNVGTEMTAPAKNTQAPARLDDLAAAGEQARDYLAQSKAPNTLRGYYDIAVLGKLIGWSMLSSVGMASIGLVYFSRRDV